MAWIKVIPPSEAPAELAQQYGRMHDKEENVANILAVHSLNRRCGPTLIFIGPSSNLDKNV